MSGHVLALILLKLRYLFILLLFHPSQPGDPPFTPQKIKIGIVTFNEYIHYYWVRPDAPHPISMP